MRQLLEADRDHMLKTLGLSLDQMTKLNLHKAILRHLYLDPLITETKLRVDLRVPEGWIAYILNLLGDYHKSMCLANAYLLSKLHTLDLVTPDLIAEAKVTEPMFFGPKASMLRKEAMDARRSPELSNAKRKLQDERTFRDLAVGEVLEADDEFMTTSGKWEPTPIIGAAVVDNGVQWRRPIDGGKDADSFKLNPGGARA